MKWTKMLAVAAMAMTLSVSGQTTSAPATAAAGDQGWTPLFNGKDFTGFYTVFKTAKKGPDTDGYFKVETVDGEPAVHVMGFPVLETKRDFGYFVTEKEYGDFDLKFQYKWGEKKHPPRAKAKRDAGCIYFVNGEDQVWPDGVECQVQEGDTGDLWVVGKTISVNATIKDEPANSKGEFTYSSTGKSVTVSKRQQYKDATGAMKDVDGRIVQQQTADALTGWNTVEVIAKGNTSVHIVNGRIVNRLTDMQFIDGGKPLDHGKILFQAEGSEVYYRDMEIRPLGENETVPGTQAEYDARWQVNDRARPRPGRMEPVAETELAASAKAPVNAVVLFDGKDLSNFLDSHWKLIPEENAVEITPNPKKAAAANAGAAPVKKEAAPLTSTLSPEELAAKGNLVTKEAFGSCKVHLEFACPNPPKGKDQAQANSGVYLMGKYEMQVLDNTNNPTYADGLAGAVYGENPPLWESSRPSGEWNYYDIEFHRPIFGADGKVERPATVTAWLNGIKVQDNFALTGPTEHQIRLPYVAHADKLPLMLQGHGQVAKFRNIWVVPISD